MKKSHKKFMVGLGVLALLIFTTAIPVLSSENMTIVGTVTSDFRIVTDDDQIFEIAEGEKGDEVTELFGKKVRVSGTVEEVDGVKVIEVASYEVVEE